MFKVLFHVLTFAGHLVSTPIYIIHDACGVDQEVFKKACPYPFSVQAQYLEVKDADFKDLKNQTIGYQQYDSSFLATLPITQQSGFLFSVGYLGTRVRWQANDSLSKSDVNAIGYLTFQDQSHYNYISTSFGAYTLSLKNWQWSVLFSGLFDPSHFNIGYGLYQAVVSGKYQATEQLSVVFGVINETGLHQEKAWPLLGATYKPNEKLTLNCIYPVNFSIEYQCTSVCNFGAAYRLTRFRKKLPTNKLPSSRGIFEYQGREIEGNIKLTPWPGSFIKLFYGWSVGSDISLADSHNNNMTAYPFKSSPFFGGSAVISF
ncbi:hypothetical protein CP10139811_0373 [Chlamydia ibidis]|uniref:Autotransporter beta-domain protein n=2 Tax=Chlamydia ibidis TaxID=1405396 RepID=S7J296_9CHLA|nr:hypothetical protein [Chlamydia ibidis]EPP34353.1 hypothetical protein CP10139811_0373 [Chlamydia ibidis]EQM62912.1 hypothetical protein H359_0382 [Chlamydia ibidis 10-1398/6]